MSRIFYILGAGPGAPAALTGEARQALAASDAVFATARLTALDEKAVVCPFGELAARALDSDAPTVAVLVSGDVGFFSAAARLREQLAPYGEVRLVCGLSSLQYFCAKLGVPYDDVCVRSLHGRAGSILGAISYHKKVFALTGGAQNAQTVCRALADAGLGGLTVHLGENLGMETERIAHGTVAELAAQPCGEQQPHVVSPMEARRPRIKQADEEAPHEVDSQGSPRKGQKQRPAVHKALHAEAHQAARSTAQEYE